MSRPRKQPVHLSDTSWNQPPVTRRERTLFLAVFATGILLRTLALSHSAVEHFDEGVYASNIYFGPPEYAYPLQRFYAPPLLPALIEVGMIAGLLAGLPANLTAFLPSFLAGCGTIAALWWVGRSWFGPKVGLCAATLCTFSDFHICYSAAALTDVLLGLWLLLAVDAIGRSLLHGDLRWTVAGGIFTGLAWWTKYNGWLPLAIEAASLPLLWLFLKPPPKQLQQWMISFGVTLLVACLVWSPYFISLRSTGGYAPIAANHAKYVVGFAGWLDAAARQVSNQWVIEGPLSWIGLAIGVFIPANLLPRSTVQISALFVRHLAARMFLAVCIAFLCNSFFVVGVAALIGIARMALTLRFKQQFDESDRRRAVGLTLLAFWFGGMLIAIPCYTAYPRLVLPGLLAAWLGAALNINLLIDASDSPAGTRPWTQRAKLLALAACGLLLAIVSSLCRLQKDLPFLAKHRGRIQEIAQLVRNHDHTRQYRLVYVLGEPALFFQLRAAGEDFVAPIQKVPNSPAWIDGKVAPTFLMIGPHAASDPQFRMPLAAPERHWRLVESFPYQPSPLVWLDLHDPRQPRPAEAAQQLTFRLYEFRP